MSKKNKADSPEGSAKGKKRKKVPARREPHSELVFGVSQHLNDLDCLREMFSQILPILDAQDTARQEELKAAIDRLTSGAEAKDSHRVSEEAGVVVRAAKRLLRANNQFRSNTFVSLVSRHDEFIGDIVRRIFRTYPDRLKSNEKTLTYEEIFYLADLDELRERVIAKEAEKVVRESHVAHIKYLETQLKATIKETLGCWSTFVELTQRRHLIVHCGGQVSQQYLKVCAEHGVKINRASKTGSRFGVSPDYFESAFKTLFEVGFKLGDIVLRHLFPANIKETDSALNAMGVELMADERWDLASLVFHYACGLPHKTVSNDEYRKIFIVNKAITFRWTGRNDAALKLLDSVDWSSSNTKFALAVTVLRENYDDAERIMKSMDGKTPISDHDFQSWPAFRDFRKTDQFRHAYKHIYGRDFSEAEIAQRLAQEATVTNSQSCDPFPDEVRALTIAGEQSENSSPNSEL